MERISSVRVSLSVVVEFIKYPEYIFQTQWSIISNQSTVDSNTVQLPSLLKNVIKLETEGWSSASGAGHWSSSPAGDWSSPSPPAPPQSPGWACSVKCKWGVKKRKEKVYTFQIESEGPLQLFLLLQLCSGLFNLPQMGGTYNKEHAL